MKTSHLRILTTQLIILALSTFFNCSWAGESNSTTIQISGLIYGGTGCNQGTLPPSQMNWDEKSKTLKVTFSNYEAKALARMPIVRRNCNLSIPFKMNSKEKLKIKKINFDYSVELSKGSDGTVQIETFFAGKIQTPTVEKFHASQTPISENKLMHIEPVFESTCGESGNIRAQTSAAVLYGLAKSESKITARDLEIEFEITGCP